MQLNPLHAWFKKKNWKPFSFQEESWAAIAAGQSGLVNAPTGSGKTFALALPIILEAAPNAGKGLQAIWITPIRALSNDLLIAFKDAAKDLAPQLNIELRTGDSSEKDKRRQREKLPDILITTPESLHLLLSQKESPKHFKYLNTFVIDEWHELFGSKRGVQVELALSTIKHWNKDLKVWGISATIGNLEEAKQVLFGKDYGLNLQPLIKASHKKQIEINTIEPVSIDELPWAGHLGIKLIEKVIPLFNLAKTTLLFTNTRAQTEIWYQQILEVAPQLAGSIAMHHGSLSSEIRNWVEEQLHLGSLKVVVCTSSLDLGIDFRPVEQVIQVGSPKGIARFIQRAGRSGHQPGAVSRIYFLPTHALELLEVEALRGAIDNDIMESRYPVYRAFDVLCQYLLTLSCGPGFYESELFEQVKKTFCFESMNEEDWRWVMLHLTKGGQTLEAYDEYKKLVQEEDGKWVMQGRKNSMQHKLSMGTIVGDQSVQVKLMKGTFLGTLEEYFATNLKAGDVFGFAGRNLEMVQLKGNVLMVRVSKQQNTKIPSWQGGRMPLSTELGSLLREKVSLKREEEFAEFIKVKPLLILQENQSALPTMHQFLIEELKSKEGFHLFIYPFEGRLVHEGLAALVAYRLSCILPISISMAMNDYGFELISDQVLDAEELLSYNIFTEDNLRNDLLNSINAAEMARRKFRDIAHISGLIFRGYPGKPMKGKHLQANSALFFEVFTEYDPKNLLLQQAYEELLQQQYEENRMRATLKRISQSEIIIKKLEKPSPLAFPLMVDRLRGGSLSSESLADRVKRLELSFVNKLHKKKQKV